MWIWIINSFFLTLCSPITHAWILLCLALLYPMWFMIHQINLLGCVQQDHSQSWGCMTVTGIWMSYFASPHPSVDYKLLQIPICKIHWHCVVKRNELWTAHNDFQSWTPRSGSTPSIMDFSLQPILYCLQPIQHVTWWTWLSSMPESSPHPLTSDASLVICHCILFQYSLFYLYCLSHFSHL